MFAAIATQGKARDRRLTVALLLAVAVWPGIAHPEDPPRIEVFTSHAFPVTGLADDGARDVAIYRLDGLAALEAALSVDLPADPEAARAEALRRLGDIDAAQVAHAREAAEGLKRPRGWCAQPTRHAGPRTARTAPCPGRCLLARESRDRRLDQSYREAGKVKKRTLANLSKWPADLVDGLKVLLGGGRAVARLDSAFDVVRTRPHGHVAAVFGCARRIGLERHLGARCAQRDLALALIVARVLAPCSKLATARGLQAETRRDSLADVLDLDEVDENNLYAAMDWLRERQERIENRLAKRHLAEGALVLYDLTSSYLEGRCCPLAKRGYSRDAKRGKLQIEFGLLCDREGCPVAVEVFDGNTADPATVGAQIDKLRRRFGLSRVVLVGDRGMLTEARIREEVKPAGLDWISALRAPALRELVDSGAVQPTLFDEVDLVEIRSQAYPGERLMVCRNPLLAAQRARKREELLRATEELLEPIAQATRRAKRRLTGRDQIGLRVGKVLGRHKMAKHFESTWITVHG